MSIRWWLTFRFSVVVLVILLLAGGVLYILLQRYLSEEIDTDLVVHSARVHGTLSLDALPEPLDYNVVHSRLPPVNEFASPGTYIQLVDEYGDVVVKSDNLGKLELPVSPSLLAQGAAGKAATETVAAGNGSRLRIMVSPLHLSNRTILLEVARSLQPMDAMMSQVRLAGIASIVVALTLVGLSGIVLVSRTLEPVGRITEIARRIEAGSDLTRRVGYKGPADEIGRLAATFDHMIEHLDRVFQSHKRFVADASHELRSPLTVIRGNLDLLKRNLSEDDRKECLRAIETEAGRMTKIVSDLLLLAEVESGQVKREEDVALDEVLLSEFKRAQSLAGKRKVAIGRQEPVTARGDAHSIRQLLGNLVDNAIKYTPEEGTITLSLYRNGEWACLEVADTGIGIAPEHIPHIFDRFYRVDKARSRVSGGTGLGLAIAKGIAEQLGGSITVDSEPGKGSVFSVWLEI